MRAAFAYSASRVLDIILNLEKCCMHYGYTGKILHVDLDNSKTEVEALRLKTAPVLKALLNWSVNPMENFL